ETFEAESGAHDLFVVTALGVDVAESRKRGSRDDAVAQVVRRSDVLKRRRRVVLAAGTSDEVGTRRIDEVLLCSDAGGLHHVVALARSREGAASIEDQASALEGEDAAELGVEPEVVTDLNPDGPEASWEDRQLVAGSKHQAFRDPRQR